MVPELVARLVFYAWIHLQVKRMGHFSQTGPGKEWQYMPFSEENVLDFVKWLESRIL